MNRDARLSRARTRLFAASAGILLLTALMTLVGPAAMRASSAQNTVGVDPASTYKGVGDTFTATVYATADVPMSGAASALSFDTSTLQLQSLARDSGLVADGVSFAGWPGASTMASFIATANTSGAIPTIGWTFTDGSANTYGGAVAANTQTVIFTATFKIMSCGSSWLSPHVVPGVGGMLDGTVTTAPPTRRRLTEIRSQSAR